MQVEQNTASVFLPNRDFGGFGYFCKFLFSRAEKDPKLKGVNSCVFGNAEEAYTANREHFEFQARNRRSTVGLRRRPRPGYRTGIRTTAG